jgi:lipopolysaccharide/colanic/teichoic acid biosynthesis glycosyltransferase
LGELTISDDPRVLPFGKFLRKTKINELPQLINIILGDLSIIGPRPQPPQYFYAYNLKDRKYITQMRPGLSGIGSILFRNEELIISSAANPVQFDTEIIIPYKAKVEKWFVRNFSILLYFELIAFTFLVVFFPRNNFHNHILKRLPFPPAELASYLYKDLLK